MSDFFSLVLIPSFLLKIVLLYHILFALKSFGLDLFSLRLVPKLSSALERFTILFGMGRGSTTPLKRPKDSNVKSAYLAP